MSNFPEKSPESVNIGGALKIARFKKGIPLTRVAEECRVSYGYLSRLENNHTIPSIHLLHRLEDVLSADLSDAITHLIYTQKELKFSLADTESNTVEYATLMYLCINRNRLPESTWAAILELLAGIEKKESEEAAQRVAEIVGATERSTESSESEQA